MEMMTAREHRAVDTPTPVPRERRKEVNDGRLRAISRMPLSCGDRCC